MAQIYNLNLIPGRGVVAVNVSQYDVGREIQFVLYNGDEQYTPTTGTVIVCNGTKSDQSGFAVSTTWSGSTVTVLTDATMTDICGVSYCELVLTVNNTRIGTANFIMVVEQAGVSEDTEFNSAQIAYVADALARLGDTESIYDTLTARIDNIVAPSGDPSLTEVADIRVGYDGTTYASAGDAVREQAQDLKDELGVALSLSASVNASALPSGTNLDSFKTPGNYIVTSATMSSMTGTWPTTSSCKLYVSQLYNSTVCYQIIIPATATQHIWFRLYTSSWRDWTDLCKYNTDVWSLLYTDASTIPSTADLNDYTTEGNYRCTSGSVASNVTNTPDSLATAFSLKVASLTNSARLAQTIEVMDSNATVYRRIYNGTAWKPWRRMEKIGDGTVFEDVRITSANVADYFTSPYTLSQALPNTIFGIDNTLIFEDAPAGDFNMGAGRANTGNVQGTLYTFSQSESHSAVQSGLTQIFVGKSVSINVPSLFYRIALLDDNDSYVWTAWCKFNPEGYLHATNQFIYAGYTSETISDLDDAPNNSIMQIDLNMNGSDADHTLGHHPAPGVSCVVITYAFSNSTNHGRVQEVYTITGKKYWRYNYKQNSTTFLWTDWRYNPPIPEPPTTDGTYTLQCTVSSGSASYAWV